MKKRFGQVGPHDGREPAVANRVAIRQRVVQRRQRPIVVRHRLDVVGRLVGEHEALVAPGGERLV
jgi:hypothetical protein